MIDVEEGAFYVGFWFVRGFAGEQPADWMGVLYRAAGSTSLVFRYRFRYYEDDKLFDASTDVKNWYLCDFAGKTDDEALEIVDGIERELVMVSRFCGTTASWKLRDMRFRRVINGDGRAFATMLVGLPFAHTKTPSAAERAAHDAAKNERN